MEGIAKQKYDNWCELISARGRLEVDLLRVAGEYLTDEALEELNRLILAHDYKWAGLIMQEITNLANQGYEEMKAGQS